MRETLRRSRLLDYCSRSELIVQTGHPPRDWPAVAVKELVDNSLDACEEARIEPEIEVQVGEDGISVQDNGPGIPAGTIQGVLDFDVRVSSREAYAAPDRGRQGQALKTIAAMPMVLDGKQGRIEIAARGVRHEVTVRVDPIRQEPKIEHRTSASDVKIGTIVHVRWPDSACLVPDDENCEYLQDDDGLEEPGDGLLEEAKEHILRVAEDFSVLNPHLKLLLNLYGVPHQFEPTNPAWRKWRPSDPSSAHWYDEETFDRLIAALIAHDAGHGRDRTVREFIRQFHGMRGTAKQKAVLEQTRLARVNLSALADDDGMRLELTHGLLRALQHATMPIKPSALGLIGRDQLETQMGRLGCDLDTFKYHKAQGLRDGVPWVAEAAFATFEDGLACRRLIAGINWSPAIADPFRQLGDYGESLGELLEDLRAGPKEPIAFVLHVVSPRVRFTDRGKSAMAFEY